VASSRRGEDLLVDLVPVVMSAGPGNDWWRSAPERRSRQTKNSASATLASQRPMARG
jgi:hypothetical protein